MKPQPLVQSGLPKRRRLKPQERMEEILDAALFEFSENGFSAARMEDIAKRAGLSKGGLYAHFASKEELLEALLTQQLQPRVIAESFIMAEGETIEQMVERFLDEVYASINSPNAIATIKLLITEGIRAPHLVKSWLAQFRDLHRARQKAIFTQCIKKGLLRPSAVTDHPELLTAPALASILLKIALEQEAPAHWLQEYRAAHRALLLDLLLAPGPSGTSPHSA